MKVVFTAPIAVEILFYLPKRIKKIVTKSGYRLENRLNFSAAKKLIKLFLQSIFYVILRFI